MNIRVSEEYAAMTLPRDSVRMLLAQPYLQLRHPAVEPFPLEDRSESRLQAGIDNVIALACKARPHFILFPEFTIPGLAGVERLVAAMSSRDIAAPCTLIGGVTGLGRTDYESLLRLRTVPVHADPGNSLGQVPGDHWVNTSVTVLKDDNGKLSIWPQPKILPSWPEATTHHQSMFRGKAVQMFRAAFDNGVPLRFFSLLCFDWAGEQAGDCPLKEILDFVDADGRKCNAPQSLQWVFVLQHNQKPNHHTFVTPGHDLLSNRNAWPFVERRDAAIVMVGTASSVRPGRGDKYGYSSVIFSPASPFDNRACVPTVSFLSKRLRGTDGLGECKDVIFREMGECIHHVDLRVPNFMKMDASERATPIVAAEVHHFVDAIDDPRVPGAAVPAPVKWANDEFDLLPDLAADHFAGSPLKNTVENAQRTSVSQYRRLQSNTLAQRVHWACAARRDRRNDPAADGDDWGQAESEGLKHLMSTLTLIGIVQPLDLIGATFHGREPARGVEIVTIHGRTHEECKAAFSPIASETHSPILFISRDRDNSPCLPTELASFTDPRGGGGIKLIDANSVFAKAKGLVPNEYDAFIRELLNVTERRIV
jgi:hypothetical protein